MLYIPRMSQKVVGCLGLILLGCLIFLYRKGPCISNAHSPNLVLPKTTFTPYTKVVPYHREMPLVFIGGVPRSGTTLMRAMLDAHPDVRCGEETHIIPRVLGLRYSGLIERSFSSESFLNLNEESIDSAFAAFILEIMALHGEAAPYLCNKDPFTHRHIVYLKEIFPNAKFILMIRDGRATTHSIISRNVTVGGFNIYSYRDSLSAWNRVIGDMYSQCLHVGSNHCMLVKYENLVLRPRLWMERILIFLNITWDSSVLHHEDFIDKPRGVSVSKTELSSDQIIKPVNLKGLYNWIDNIPGDAVKDLAKIAPMLETLGYDLNATFRSYGKPDRKVAHNTYVIERDAAYWRQKEKEFLEYRHTLLNISSRRKPMMVAPGTLNFPFKVKFP